MRSYNKFNHGILITALIMLSCNKSFIKEKPLDFLSPVNSYASVEGIEQGLVGMYSYARDTWFNNVGTQNYGLYSMGTDVGYDGETPGGQRFLNNYETSVTPTYSVIGAWWRQLFAQIQQANVLINGINNLDESLWQNEDQKNEFLGEAKFFRAFAYRIAVTMWGDIPLITEVTTGAKTDFKRNPTSEIYKQLEDDLIFAANYLPERGREKAPGRLTRGAAYHVLSEVYLAQGKNREAVNADSKVINELGYALMQDRFGNQDNVFGTGDVYWDMFRYDNQNLPENTEGIWVAQFEPNTDGGGEQNWSNIYNPRLSRFGNGPDGLPAYSPQYQDTLGVGVARSRGTSLVFYKIWASDWNNDIRNAEHNIKRHFYYSNPNSVWNGKEIRLSDFAPGIRDLLRDTTNFIYPFVMKGWQPVTEVQRYNTRPETGGGGRTHADWYVMRLAETYLLRAEGYIKLGMIDSAAADINVVRRRAHANPVSSEDVDLDYLLDERVRELYGEEMRLIVLLRMGKLIERTRRYNDNPLMPGANIQDHNNLFPIPQAEIDLNRDEKWQQNPGYPG